MSSETLAEERALIDQLEARREELPRLARPADQDVRYTVSRAA